MIKISDIKLNPNNPRLIKDDKFRKLVKSIEEFPKMMALRPIVINADSVVLGGNMRLKALQQLKYKEIPDEWVKRAEDLTEDEARRFIIADNVGFGEHDWDMLANEWDEQELTDWGLDFDFEPFQLEKPKKVKEVHELKNYEKTHVLISFSPEKLMEIQALLEKLKSFEFIEYEQSSN